MQTSIKCTVGTLLGPGSNITKIECDADYLARVMKQELSFDEFQTLKDTVRNVGVTPEFREIIDFFSVAAGETPAGFRVEKLLESDGTLRFHLARDIAWDKNGVKRPTELIFSVDTANPYEIEPIKYLVGNLTCNPGIVYDLFINNPKANVGGLFKTREEVMAEIGRILGPGCDISVELNNPFEADFDKILDEVKTFEEILSKYRLVVKVPHTGPVNAQNVHQLLEGDKLLCTGYNEGSTASCLHGHNLALRLHEYGYRVNFTLMFEPWQTALALQARPYFINTFVRHRANATATIKGLLAAYEATEMRCFLEQIRAFLIKQDFLSPSCSGMDLLRVLEMAQTIVRQRHALDVEGSDGLDAARHSLRWLRNTSLPDTRLIICSMEGDINYPDIVGLLTEPEFIDMHDRVVITAEPNYLAVFSSAPQVVSYQRRFMNAAKPVECEVEAVAVMQPAIQTAAVK
ncbi:MAG: transaldolase [Armatimonadetes bacterium]|nr:transaldolase [Armatimonadota bacterium]